MLDWWKENSPRFPILSKIARDVFAVPTSTVVLESTFSLGKRVVDPFRSSLTPQIVECLVCMSDWLKATGFSMYKSLLRLKRNFMVNLRSWSQVIFSLCSLFTYFFLSLSLSIIFTSDFGLILDFW